MRAYYINVISIHTLEKRFTAGCEIKTTKEELSRFSLFPLAISLFIFGWMKNECKFKETTATFVNQEQKCCFRRQQQQKSKSLKLSESNAAGG